ncbi:MAG: hypothetical protein R3279_07530 [Putridiphycobacter sp.]|nr:hypothetical protein [Putridiphycobacter sp.]
MIAPTVHTNPKSSKEPINLLITGNPPLLAPNQRWRVEGYLLGKHVNKSPQSFESYTSHHYLRKSGGYYHFTAKGQHGDIILICTIDTL